MQRYRIFRDKLVRVIMIGLTFTCILLLFIIGIGLLIKSFPIIHEKSIGSLLSTSSWKPFKGEFGFLVYIISTLYVTAIAVFLAFPPSLFTGIYLSEYASEGVRKFFQPVIDLLAGIPPVIYGVWGTLAIVPFISGVLAPHFVDFSTGYSVITGGIVLAVMIIPLMVSLMIEIFRSIPGEIREASASLGATRWQTIKKVVLRKSLPGIIAVLVLAISRAFGETIAVLMVCGNMTVIPHSVFDACYPLPALIANNYGEMMSMPDYESALMFAALLLFIIIVLFNASARLVLHRVEKSFSI